MTKLTTTFRSRRDRRATRGPATITAAVTIRPSCADDVASLARLAALDSAEVPLGPVLLAEVGGELRAALSLADGSTIADPFFPTLGLLALLRTHAAGPTPGRAPRRRYRLSYA